MILVVFMTLDNFILEEYNEKNMEHKTVLVKLENDLKTQKYLGDLEILNEFIKENKNNGLISNFYIVYFHYNPIGIITINQYNKFYEISYGILPEYRKQNFAVLLLKEFSKKLFKKYKEIDQLDLRINIKNIGSQRVATLAGFENDYKCNYTMKRRVICLK